MACYQILRVFKNPSIDGIPASKKDPVNIFCKKRKLSDGALSGVEVRAICEDNGFETCMPWESPTRGIHKNKKTVKDWEFRGGIYTSDNKEGIGKIISSYFLVYLNKG